jgi:putative MATE family efflux protein
MSQSFAAGLASPTAAQQRSARLLNGPVLATLAALAAPNIVVMLAQAAANFLESYYVGLLGVDALAGAALVFPLVMLMQMMSAGGIGGGISSSVARALGAGQPERAAALALHAFVIALAAGLLFAVGAILGGPVLYRAIGGQGAALDNALAYSDAIFAGAVFIWLSNALASVLRGSGNMVLPAAVLTGGVFVLFGVSPLLMFGAGPVPALGVRGAGLALVVYYMIGSCVLGISLLRGHGGVRLSFRHRLSGALFRDILGVGGLAVVNNFTTNIAIIAATALVTPLGNQALAGFGLGIRLEYMQIPVVFGIGTGMVAMVGMNIGAGQRARARAVAWTGAAMAFAATESIGLAAALFPRAWLGLFTQDQAAIDVGTTYLRTVGPAYGLIGIGLALYFASQGARRMGWSVFAGLLRVAIIVAGGTLIGPRGVLPIIVLGLAAFAVVNAVPWRKKTVLF